MVFNPHHEQISCRLQTHFILDKAIAARHSNLHVVNEGSVIPWLLAARALIANGCIPKYAP